MSEDVTLIFTSDYSIWEVLKISKADPYGDTITWAICCTQRINECREWTWIHLEYVITIAMKIDIGAWHHRIW